MIIYLDFDGTVVEHEYPKIGRENFGCMPVIKKLQDAGHTIILNTYRSNTDSIELQKALDYINLHEVGIVPIKATTEKFYPPVWSWNRICETQEMYIDDQASQMPLKRAIMTKGHMVNWDYLDKEFERNGIYKPVKG